MCVYVCVRVSVRVCVFRCVCVYVSVCVFTYVYVWVRRQTVKEIIGFRLQETEVKGETNTHTVKELLLSSEYVHL